MAERRAPGARNAVRIIGGALRGRRLAFADAPGLRPTGDRIRETLFNWLAPVIAGARCLDLYAGSGALGIEAASRGASRVRLVERDPRIARQIEAELARLQVAERADVAVVVARAEDFLAGPDRTPWDVVFVDPPFGAVDLAALLAVLAQPGRLAAGARVYVEQPRSAPLPELPPGWHWHRNLAAGQVGYHLAAATAG